MITRLSHRAGFHRWLLGAGVIAACLVVVGHARARSTEDRGLVRDITLTYRARIPHLPRDAREVRAWIPLASTRGGQRILERRIQTSLPYTVTQDPEYGNEVLYLRLAAPLPNRLEVAVAYRAQLLDGGRVMPEPAPTPTEVARELQPRGLLIIDDEVRARTLQAVAGRSNRLQQARGIYEHVIRHMAYDKQTPGWGHGDVRRACRLGRGNCTDFHSLFIAMARAAGIPARFAIGVLVPEGGSGTLPGYHCWAEFYTSEQGWVQVDASEAWKHPARADEYFGQRRADRFLISQGRDLRVMPPPRGGPVNILFVPYVEVDGTAYEHVETEVQCADLTQEGMA